MYSIKHVEASTQMLTGNLLYGNPHSSSTMAGQRTMDGVNLTRHEIASFFNTTLEEYEVVFTSGATAGLKLIGETFPFTDDSTFAYSVDSHNSVVGIRSYAEMKKANIAAVPIDQLDSLEEGFNGKKCSSSSGVCNLIAFPGECNFSGRKHSLEIIDPIHDGCLNSIDLSPHLISTARHKTRGKWFVLLDAAKLAATNPIDLSLAKPDFMVISFYKLFGYPTGLGALLIKKSSAYVLQKSYFGGGTLAASLSTMNISHPREEIHRQFEDGTISYLSILACRNGFRMLKKLSMVAINQHVGFLTKYLYAQLHSIRHHNGAPICEIYGSHHQDKNPGSIIACNFLRPDGSFVGYAEFNNLASLHNIHIRTGCFCNPGACQNYLELSSSELLTHIDKGHVCGDSMDIINGRPTGAIRISFGFMSTVDEIDTFLSFVATYFVSSTLDNCTSLPAPLHLPQTDIRLCGIVVFPIKSCCGMKVEKWKIGKRGLLFDREWALMDPSTRRVFRQKDLPQMTQIKPVINLESQTLVVTSCVQDQVPLTIPLSFVPSNSKELRVCHDQCEGSKYDDLVNDWFTIAVGRPCSLVRVPPDSNRQAAFQNKNSKSSIGFANEAQYLLLSRGSVRQLNARLKDQVSEDIFRANLVVDGCLPHEEDEWSEISIGSQLFSFAGPCSRCSMININQETGEFQPSPLQTLAKYRRERSKIFFGQFLDLIASGDNGNISVGDAVTVKSRGKSPVSSR